MGSIGNVPNGISFVAAALGGASGSSPCGANSQDLEKVLQSASPSDAVVLSSAAFQLQQADGIFGLPSPASPSNSFQTPELAGNSTLPPGVSSSDLANATPDQLATLAVEAQALEQHASLFTSAPTYQGNLNVLG
ncbi:MAG TPA: hypothetical protein VGZ73_11365 [Bryobacteraceae bacterium]|jgi:hypothetical protein|nr:hypothetical protein [Bryobacteraceae bacterium]